MTMFVSALALTSLDAVARISRMSFQEFFEVEEGQEPSSLVKVLTNKYVSTIISLVCGYLLSLGGYVNIWPLFGSANQLLAAMVLISLAVFLKVTGRKGFMLYIPMDINVYCYNDSISTSYLWNRYEIICNRWICFNG